MKQTTLARGALLALIALLAFAGCASGQVAKVPEEPAAEEEAAMDEFVSTAMVVTFGDGEVLFVDQDTGAPYYPTNLPSDAPELAAGNIVRVTGNGIMLESYPAQYPGITGVEVIEEGTSADAEKYDELVAQIWQPKDPSEPPLASLEYTTELAVVTLSPTTCGYMWTYEQDGEERTVAVDTLAPTDYASDELPDATLEGPTEVTTSFDVEATGIEVMRWSEDALDVEGEKVEVAGLTFTAEPDYRYAILATFDAGEVTYAFTA
ncbi:hypothetical protein INF26_06095 [Olsenella sp. DSM 107455]|uniref:Uncharacterized protein n=1 Tax=Thermophilibacter gallinarum TaxID=2779357 RepID=A0ABR9QTY8_9ACTN|nr:hypothetical protein [Thermophilibacter gallinarum]MBE5024424.1 hypothetical protein [Thermophilibacter gallinarum]